jgi:hypothetical protein
MMSVQETFEKEVHETLITMVDKSKPSELPPDSQLEVEVRLKKKQSISQFKRIVEFLQRKKVRMEQGYSLDISYIDDQKTPVRVTIDALTTIKDYCRGANLEELHKSGLLKFITKIKDDPTDLDNYGLRLQVSMEKTIKDADQQARMVKYLTNQQNPCMYRYKQRFEFYMGYYRFDLTLVKEGPDFHNRTGKGILLQDEIYEVEMEIIDHTKLTTERGYLADLYEIMRLSQDSFQLSLAGDLTKTLNAYYTLVGFKEGARYPFIGVDVMPMTPENASNLENYSVTEKADGNRCLLYVTGEDKMYLITNRMELRNTGLTAPAGQLSNSLFDGELVRRKASAVKDTTKTPFLYLLFDCFYYKGVDRRDQPLYAPAHDDRYTDIVTAAGVLKNTKSTSLEFNHKTYYFATGTTSIHTLNKTLLDGYHKFDYELDGLIFTPYTDPYPKASPSRKIKWKSLLKWKPLNQLSIDFRVKFVNKTLIDVPETDRKCIEVKFTVSGGRDDDGEVEFPRPDEVRHSTIYFPIDPQSSQPLTEVDGNIIYDGAIVECVYDTEQTLDRKVGITEREQFFFWKPLRIRFDKTYPNSIQVAQSTWEIIDNPITQEDICDKNKLQEKASDYYSATGEKMRKLVEPMLDYHNSVKSYLFHHLTKHIREVSKRRDYEINLMDVAAGQLGDLRKWYASKINRVVAIELSAQNIRRGKNRLRKSPMTGITYVCGDTSKEIIHTNDLSNTRVSGCTPDDRLVINRVVGEFGYQGFDLISCQFAIHYFMEREEKIRGLLQNVKMHLRTGGYFFGTTLDGRSVLDAFNNAKTDLLEGHKQERSGKDHVIWRLTKKFSGNQLTKFSQQITAMNIHIDEKDMSEWLFNYDYFAGLAKEYGLVPAKGLNIEDTDTFDRLKETLLKDTDFWSRLSNSKDKIESIRRMSPAECQYSNMTRYFIFRKV